MTSTGFHTKIPPFFSDHKDFCPFEVLRKSEKAEMKFIILRQLGRLSTKRLVSHSCGFRGSSEREWAAWVKNSAMPNPFPDRIQALEMPAKLREQGKPSEATMCAPSLACPSHSIPTASGPVSSGSTTAAGRPSEPRRANPIGSILLSSSSPDRAGLRPNRRKEQ